MMNPGEAATKIPLANLEDNKVLTCLPTQDVYFITDSKGTSVKIPLNNACILYLEASNNGGIVWGSGAHVPGRRKKHQRQASDATPRTSKGARRAAKKNAELDALLAKEQRELDALGETDEKRPMPEWKRLLHKELAARPGLASRLNLDDWD